MEELIFEVDPHCFICGKEGHIFYEGLTDRLYGVEGVFSFYFCPYCNVLWLNPRPSEESISACYRGYYTKSSSAEYESSGYNKKIKNYLKKIAFCRAEHDSNWLKMLSIFLSKIHTIKYSWIYRKRPLPKFKQGFKLLDIGCGNGHFIFFLQKLGWDCTGIELDKGAAELGRVNYHVNILTEKLPTASLSYDYFNVITMYHVIEHLHKPDVYVKECYKLLQSGGFLIITTPNINSLVHKQFKQNWFALDPPRHLTIWSAKALSDFIKSYGFEIVKCSTSFRCSAFNYQKSDEIALKSTTNFDHKISLGAYLFSLKNLVLSLIKNDYGEEIQIIAKKA
jgi:2-polyprenyl-3-methyl-5-hydroxy-6-metoxy-1,4-benzoquinol methylase